MGIKILNASFPARIEITTTFLREFVLAVKKPDLSKAEELAIMAVSIECMAVVDAVCSRIIHDSQASLATAAAAVETEASTLEQDQNVQDLIRQLEYTLILLKGFHALKAKVDEAVATARPVDMTQFNLKDPKDIH